MGQMIDSAYPIDLDWWRRRKGVIDAAVVYIGGPRNGGHTSIAYTNQLRSKGLRILGCYVGYQAADINKAQNPVSLAKADIAIAEQRQFDYGLCNSPIAWDFEYAPVSAKVRAYLDTVAALWSHGRQPKRILYSSDSCLKQYQNNSFSGIWCANYRYGGYNANATYAPHLACQYAGNVKWDGASVDISAYDLALFSSPGGQVTAPVQDGVKLLSTPSGNGYFVVDKDGGVFAYGDAIFRGSLGGKALNAPIVDAELTPSGNGYWLLGQDNGVFAFGDAPYFGHPGGA